MAKIYLLVAGVMLCSIPVCPLDNKEIFIHLRQMKTIPSQSCLDHRHDFKFPWRRENITPIQMTQGTCYHQQALQQIFDLFTTGSSCATWNSTLLDKLLQPGSEPGTAGRSDSGLSWFGNCCPEVCPRNPSLPEGKGIWPLCLGGCQSGNWKVPFPHVRILKKSQQIQWKLYMWQLSTQSDCCFLNSPKWSGLPFAYKLKNIWNKNRSFTKNI